MKDVVKGYSVAVSLDKLEQMLDRLSLIPELADALRRPLGTQNGPLLRDKDRLF